MTPFHIVATGPKANLEGAIATAVVSANLAEPQLGQAKVAALAALRLALVMTLGKEDATLKIELTGGDGISLACSVADIS